MSLVDRGIDDGDLHVLAAGIVGLECDALEGVVHRARRLLQVVDVIGHAGRGPAVVCKLGEHDSDRATVGDAVAHDGRSRAAWRRVASGPPARMRPRCRPPLMRRRRPRPAPRRARSRLLSRPAQRSAERRPASLAEDVGRRWSVDWRRAGRRGVGDCRGLFGSGRLGRGTGRRVGEKVDDQLGQEHGIGVGRSGWTAVRRIGARGGRRAGWLGVSAPAATSAGLDTTIRRVASRYPPASPPARSPDRRRPAV